MAYNCVERTLKPTLSISLSVAHFVKTKRRFVTIFKMSQDIKSAVRHYTSGVSSCSYVHKVTGIQLQGHNE